MSDLTRPTFVRWNDAESKFVVTTADDPRRMLMKADQKSDFFSWILMTGASAIIDGRMVVFTPWSRPMGFWRGR